MNQTWENGKKTSFGPKFGPQNFFYGFYFYYMLDIVASYHCLQFQGKLKNQTWENGKKTTWFQDWFWPLRPKFGPQNFFHGLYLYCMFDIVSSYHCMQLQEKLMNQTWENDEKPSFGPKIVYRILPLLHVRQCCKLSLYAISRKTKRTAKNLVLGLILAHLAQTWATNFFFKNLTPSVTRYHGQLSSCTISEKTNDPILRKLSDGRTDREMD